MAEFLGEGLTYDDVLLVPAYSEVLPREVDIRSHFSRNIRLNVPIVSAAMDGECVRFDVEDTGIGIAPEHQQIIFEEFENA